MGFISIAQKINCDFFRVSQTVNTLEVNRLVDYLGAKIAFYFRAVP
jgi:hypothetical protein